MNVSQGGKKRNWRTALPIGALLLMLVSLLTGSGRGSALAAPTANVLGGTVTLVPGDTGVGDAIVAAVSESARRTTPTGADGSYSFATLPSGTYTLSVRSPVVSTTSPSWVYSDDPQSVTVPMTASVNLAVQAATVTVQGQLVAPTGTTFAAPNLAWVRAENQEGDGNTVQVAADGSFVIKVLPGAVMLRASFAQQSWTADTTLRGSVWYADAGQIVNVGALPVLLEQATISGTVNVQNGSTTAPAPAGIPVRAWRLDGSEFEQALTDANGAYSINVISGTWMLRALPTTDQPYVPSQSPQKVVLASDTATASQNLLITNGDVTINGQTVDSQTSAPLTTGVDGRAYALYWSNGHRVFGPTAPIKDGLFTLKLASTTATTYTVGVWFPPDLAYSALSRVTVNTAQAGSSTLSFPIMHDNADIKGALKDQTGAVVKNIAGKVWGASNSGGWERALVNPLDGTYDMGVVTTDLTGKGGSFWRLRAFVDPTSGYIVQHPREQRVFLPYNNGQGSSVTADWTLDSTASLGVINGTIIGVDGNPVQGVRVAIHELTSEEAGAIDRWDVTNANGHYSVRIPAGNYEVRAYRKFSEDFGARLHIPPAPVMVSVAAQSKQTVNLQFRASSVVVTGQVTYNDAGHAALIRARAADGTALSTTAQADGTFKISLLGGQAWTLHAVSSDDTTFLGSSTLTITPTASTTPVALPSALVLAASDTLPDSLAYSFSADEDQFFELSNGSQVQIPAGALGDGNVVLTVRPLPELAADGGAQPVSFGYRLNAYDETTRIPITHFASPVTLAIPYTAQQLQVLGITSNQLIPSYWDEASQSWKPVDNVAVVPDSTGGGVVNIAVDHFTDFALLGSTQMQYSVALPLVGN